MGQMLASRFAQPAPQSDAQADGPNNPEAAWWCKLLARAAATIGGGVAFISGIVTIFLSFLVPRCIVSGILLTLAAIIVLVFEAPICCAFLEFTKPIGAFAEKRTFLQKAIIYVVMAIIPFALCFGLSTFFGCGLIFASGVVYGLMGLGKKADRQEMMTTATAVERPRADDTRVGLIENEDMLRTEPPPPYGNQPYSNQPYGNMK